MPRRRLLIPIVSLALWSAFGALTPAQNVAEQKVKAAWLYHFGRYTKFPQNAVPNSDGKLIIGLIGPNPFGPAFDALKGRPVGDRKVELHKFATAAQYQPCHVVFISPLIAGGEERTAFQRLQNLLRERKNNVLIVSDSPGLAVNGAMINYSINANGFIDLEINRGELDRADLKLDPRVLALKNVRFVP